MQRIAWQILLCVLALTPGLASAADEGLVRFTDVVTTQFASPDADTFHINTSEQFKLTSNVQCTATDTRPVAPFVAVIGGVLIDWLFSRTVSGISKRLKKRIEAHSASYSNEPVFGDIFGPVWSNGESCVIMQRIECDVPAAAVKAGTASCDGIGDVGLSIGIKLRSEGQYIRMLPYAMHLEHLKPEHHKGQATVAATLRIEAAGMNVIDSTGYPWKSPDLTIATLACDVSKDKVYAADCAQSYGLTSEHWARSPVFPLPPATTQAFVFTVGEVGEPSQGLKGFSEFMDATQGSMSSALSEAFQKKLKLKE